ncbi:MAG: zinc ribbon domain-containing protein [Anaerolineae bacterium]
MMSSTRWLSAIGLLVFWLLSATGTAYASDCPPNNPSDCANAATTARSPVVPIAGSLFGLAAARALQRLVHGSPVPLTRSGTQAPPWMKELQQEQGRENRQIEQKLERLQQEFEQWRKQGKRQEAEELQAQIRELNVRLRQNVKRYAASLALASGDLAADFAWAAGALTLVSAATSWTGAGGLLSGAAAGGTGIMSGVAWRLSNAFQEVANDPPRNDFQTVSKFEPLQFNLGPPKTAFEAIWQDFAKQATLLSLSIATLVKSFERYDGVHTAKDQISLGIGSTVGDDLHRYEIAQIDAIAHNATAVAQLCESLLTLQPRLDQTWDDIRTHYDSVNTPVATLSPRWLKDELVKLSQSNIASMRKDFAFSESEATEFMLWVDKISQETRSAPQSLPKVLLGAQWHEAMQTMCILLSLMSRASHTLQAALRETWQAEWVCPNPKCGRPVPAGKRFCTSCGTPVTEGTGVQSPVAPVQRRCPSCKRVVPPGKEYCTYDGTRVV